MTTTIDRAGRIVIPKNFRDEMGLAAGTKIEVEMKDGKLEIQPKCVITLERRGRFLVMVAPEGTPMLSDRETDKLLNDLREGRIK
jgi:AbrB family looped-hinge helix DNA binding protein